VLLLSSWEDFPHDAAIRSVYNCGEDGLMGVSDQENRLCAGLALWNGKDHILKERLFGLTNPEVGVVNIVLSFVLMSLFFLDISCFLDFGLRRHMRYLLFLLSVENVFCFDIF